MPDEIKKPSELYPKVAECENRLNDLIKEIINIGKDMLSINGGNIYAPDLFITGVLNRTINLTDAILVLTERWNIVAAGPLIRLYLDTLLRSSYLAATKNHDAFILQILEGKQLNEIKDEKGKLTDKRLRDCARPLFPQVDNVYRETSKFVHFSDKHVFSCITPDEKIFIGKGFRKWQEKDIVSLLECTIAITKVILAIVRGWILQKVKMLNPVDETND
jgi:hypothetical protein